MAFAFARTLVVFALFPSVKREPFLALAFLLMEFS